MRDTVLPSKIPAADRTGPINRLLWSDARRSPDCSGGEPRESEAHSCECSLRSADGGTARTEDLSRLVSPRVTATSPRRGEVAANQISTFSGVVTDTEVRGGFTWIKRAGRWQLVMNEITLAAP